MSAQQKLTDEEIDHLLNLVREHWPEVFDYEERDPPLGIANPQPKSSCYFKPKINTALGPVFGESFFDYGCGLGADVRALEAMGYIAAGWDPIHAPGDPRRD